MHTDGQGDTQKAISDIEGLAAQGVNAVVVFPDAGKAMLPALTKVTKAGVVTVPYWVYPGGEEGDDYDYFFIDRLQDRREALGRVARQGARRQGQVAQPRGTRRQHPEPRASTRAC